MTEIVFLIANLTKQIVRDVKTTTTTTSMMMLSQVDDYDNSGNGDGVGGTDNQICFRLKLISFYCISLFLLSFFFNLALLLCFLIHKDLRSTPQNTFTIALCLLNFIGTILELPPIIVSNYSCRWIFARSLCVATGFLMYWIGCTSIYLLICMSLERYYIVYRPMNLRRLNRSVYISGIVISLLLGLFWSSVPLLGWSHYSFEGAGTSCSVEWSERTPAVISYNVTILILVFFLPLIVLATTNIKLIKLMSTITQKHKNIMNSKSFRKKVKLERLLTIVTVILIGSFLVSWLPYALVCIYRVFFGSELVSPFVATLPAMFAKSSMLWSSMLYFFTNKKVRVKACQVFAKVKSVQTSPSRSSKPCRLRIFYAKYTKQAS